MVIRLADLDAAYEGDSYRLLSGEEWVSLHKADIVLKALPPHVCKRETCPLCNGKETAGSLCRAEVKISKSNMEFLDTGG